MYDCSHETKRNTHDLTCTVFISASGNMVVEGK